MIGAKKVIIVQPLGNLESAIALNVVHSFSEPLVLTAPIVDQTVNTRASMNQRTPRPRPALKAWVVSCSSGQFHVKLPSTRRAVTLARYFPENGISAHPAQSGIFFAEEGFGG